MSKAKTMSEVLAAYNALALEKNREQVTSFKSLAAANAALAQLTEAGSVETTDVGTAATTEAGADTVAADGEKVIPGLDTPSNSGAKYNSSAKRGPTQGIGAFCKELIAAGKTNAEILAAVAESKPGAKTTANCVAYYRAKMAKAATPVAAAVGTITEAVDTITEAVDTITEASAEA